MTIDVSDMGPLVLGVIGLMVLFQGFSYTFKPELTGRFHRSDPKTIRKYGILMIVIGLVIAYFAASWM
jgi:uncharacterized protein YjeT (DUF2065 family)